MSQVAATVPEKIHITRTPGVCAGKPCIAGSRIRVQDVYVWHELQGKSPDEIVSSFPQLTLADVYAALAYFWDHRDEILLEMREQEDLVEQMKAQFPSKLADRPGAQGNAIPSR
ncbi:MAG: DUF433 domain-containing protein [Planctomycetes bacterium]|nr:DUF433 domain-containing protein [Planctomycetota bacterium]